VPLGYPRRVRIATDFSAANVTIAWYVSIVAGLSAVVAFVLCHKYRDTKTMVFTQPLFMMMILFGFFLICCGSALYTMEPEYRICAGSMWLILQGFTIELGAVLVKTSAINQLVQSSKKMIRIHINRNVMLMKVVAFVLVVSAFLTTWMFRDPFTATTARFLYTENDVTFVEIDVKCASESNAWMLSVFAWELILLLLAAVLAYQSRTVMKQLNESKSLAIMVYVHFFFFCIRGVTAFLYVYNFLDGSKSATWFSLNYSLDSLCAMSIYVFPKIYQAWRLPVEDKPTRLLTSLGTSTAFGLQTISSTGGSEFDDNVEDLQILVCSANIGNAEPTMESLGAWIPVGGSCSEVNFLEGAVPLVGTFDLIAIGMQEATWTPSAGSLRDIASTEKSPRAP